MLQSFNDYFREIELPKPLIEKAQQICDVYAEAFEGPLTDLVVCDHFEPEGARRYTSLWLRLGRYVVEAKNFVTEQNIDFTLVDRLEYVEFVRSDLTPFDKHTSPRTTLHVTARFSPGINGTLTASHNNCRYLYAFSIQNFLRR